MKFQAKGRLLLFLAAVMLKNVNGIPEDDASAGNHPLRSKKHFSLFSVVTFKNEECNSASTFVGGVVQGTCYTATECSDKKGTKSGNCASGFGVCCIFVSNTGLASTIKENRTIIRNPLFPTVETSGFGTTIDYTVNKMQSDICQLRLDFQTFVIMGPTNTLENFVDGEAALGTHCNDKLRFTLTSNYQVPILCGIMTGEHLYMDMGHDSTDTAKLSLTLASTTTVATADNARVWSIKTSQIACWSPYRAPDGCHRYLMQSSGQIASPNFATSTATKGTNKLNGGEDLGTQFLRTCLRREKGMCCVKFQVCNSFAGKDLTEATQGGGNVALGTASAIGEGWSFDQNLLGASALSVLPLSGIQTAATNDIGLVDAACTGDYVEIPDSTTGRRSNGAPGQVNTRYCGVRFGNVPQDSAANALDHAPVYDCTEPWQVNYTTDNVNDLNLSATNQAAITGPTPGRGFCLEYMQEAC